MRITHLDSQSYVASGKSVADLFEEMHVRSKRAMYEKGCRRLGHRFVPFFVLTDGVLSEPAKDFLKLLATKTADKWGMTGPGRMGVVMALIRAKVGVALVRGASGCVRGEREGRSRFIERRGAELDSDSAEEMR